MVMLVLQLLGVSYITQIFTASAYAHVSCWLKRMQYRYKVNFGALSKLLDLLPKKISRYITICNVSLTVTRRVIYYRKSVLHLRKHMFCVGLRRCSTDLR